MDDSPDMSGHWACIAEKIRQYGERERETHTRTHTQNKTQKHRHRKDGAGNLRKTWAHCFGSCWLSTTKPSYISLGFVEYPVSWVKLCSLRDFPGGPVTKTFHSQCSGPRFNPWSRI